MIALSLAQEMAVIRSMPGRLLRAADAPLFAAIAEALRLMPQMSLVGCLQQGFATAGHSIAASDAASIGRALAAVQDETGPSLGAILAAQIARVQPALQAA